MTLGGRVNVHDTTYGLDMRQCPVTVNTDLFYNYPEASVARSSALIWRPMEWFLRDLTTLSEVKGMHPDLLLCWIRDALTASEDARGIQLFTGADAWRGTWTLARAHLLGNHGYKYLSLGFSADPVPHWSVIGARQIQVRSPSNRWIDDDHYARDARRTW